MLSCTRGDVVSPVSCALFCMNCWRMLRVLPAMWNVGFAMVDEREKDRMHKESDELGALVSKLPLGGDEMSVETYIRMEGGEIIEQELSTDELVDVALGTNYAHDFDLNIDLDSVDVDVVASLIVNLSDAKRHAPLLSSFLLESSL